MAGYLKWLAAPPLVWAGATKLPRFWILDVTGFDCWRLSPAHPGTELWFSGTTMVQLETGTGGIGTGHTMVQWYSLYNKHYKRWEYKTQVLK